MTRWLRELDWWLLGSVLALVAVGVVAIDVAVEGDMTAGPAKRQLAWAGVGIVAMFAAARVPLRVTESLAYVSFGLCLPALVAVYFTEPINGAQRWLRLGPIGVQPSELTKVAYIIALARFLANRRPNRQWLILAVGLAVTAVPAVLILRQPDLGTALLFVPIFLAMLFAIELRWTNWLMLLLAGLVAAPILWAAMSPTQRARITGFLNQNDTAAQVRDDGYQLHQSKLMISFGGLTGTPDAGEFHLPFDHTDFIFSVLAGRWGLAGASATLALLAIVCGRALSVAARAVSPFGRLVAVGIVALLATQAIVNVAMTVGLAPITGLTLPFVSYGGSSLLTCLVAVGLLLGIDREQQDPWSVAGSIRPESLALCGRHI